MKAPNPWLNYLQNSGVRYSHSIHPPAETALETAAAERVLAHEIAKCVVYFCETGFGMTVVPADEFVDIVELARVLGVNYIRLATETEIAELFPDCELGAMPPFGNIYNMPVVVDRDVADRRFMAFPIGTHRDVVRLAFEDYERLVRPLVAGVVMAGVAYA